MKIGEQIRALRGILNKTQSQVAIEIGVTRTSIVSWENGRRTISPEKTPSAKKWIADAKKSEKYKEITGR